MSKKLIYALKDKGAQVIAIDWRYNSEIILDGKSGLIYRNKDIKALIKKLI